VALPLPFWRQAQEYVFRHLSRRRTQGRARKSARTPKSCSIRAKIRSQCARPGERKTKSSSTPFGQPRKKWATTKLENENKAKSTIKRERWNLAQLNREISDRPVCEIAPPELLTAFRRVEARGRYYTVGRLRSTASRFFQFGVGASYCSSDPTRDLKHALTKAPKGNPRPALTDPDDVGDLMHRIEVYDAKNGGLVRYALKLIALTMVRPWCGPASCGWPSGSSLTRRTAYG
jgi:integrase